MKKWIASSVLLGVALLSILFAGCGSSGPSSFTIGGTVSGLSGTGLVLQNSSEQLSISANGSFTFKTALASNTAYTVTVFSQPVGPTQTCSVANGSGTVTSANITNISVMCTTNTYTIGGSVTGLSGTGLVLQDNGGNNLSVSAAGSFAFSAPLASGSTYSVTVSAQPTSPWQTCTVSNGSGTVSSVNITNISVTCTTNTYTIGGTVNGLSGTGLVLQDNGGNNLSVSATGSFTFTTSLPSGSTYSVTVSAQPTSPAQSCIVSYGSGTVGGSNVTNVAVNCTSVTYTIGGAVSGMLGTGLVIQDSGGDNITLNNVGSFQFPTGVASGGAYHVTVLTQPTGPTQTCLVTYGTGTVASSNITNVQVDCASGAWTWMSGSDLASPTGTWGTQGVGSASNVPGGREAMTSWFNVSNNQLWFMGGYGRDSASNVGYLGDVWNFDITSDYWTWVTGSNLRNQAGTYGTLGSPSANNLPGGRSFPGTGVDLAGQLWVFGGFGYDSAGTQSYLNDLWRYSQGQWTWMGGSNLVNQSGTYGTLGTGSTNNIPGARDSFVSWSDQNGWLWVFGGSGYDSGGSQDLLNDLWKFDGTQWTWMGGANVIDQKGVYGTLGTASASNIPGARVGAQYAQDAKGNFWLMGGYGYDSAGARGYLNDLWKFDGSQWTWMAGSNLVSPAASYGTQGTASATNVPGPRYMGSAVVDANGNFWLMGGYGYDSAATAGYLNDLWKFSGGQWTWISGSNVVNQPGVSGSLGISAVGNVPGARYMQTGWADSSGNLWFFGGSGYATTGTGILGDVWVYRQ